MRLLILPVALLAAFVAVAAEPPAASPWGVSSSASAARNHAEWFPKVADAGVTSVRLFPEWRGVEPTKGAWTWDAADTLVANAAKHRLEITGVLMGSPPSAKAIHAFPMDDLPGWSQFVGESVGRYKGKVRHWEVWNEGNGGFNDGKHTTADYAKLAVATYDAAKKADPNAQIGLTVASFDAPYLNQTILAMKAAGTPNRFDHLCVHPYEIADGLAEPDGEIPYLWMGRTLRDVLKANAPERANAELWITEVGRRLDSRKESPVTEADAAKGLVKLYTMALAQGFAKVQWFEARDPVGEDQGFGLLGRDGTERAAFRAMKALTTALGPAPRFHSWHTLGRDGRGYSFLFEGKSSPVLVAWMPAGLSDKTIAFESAVTILDPATGKTTSAKAGQSIELTDTPVLITGLPIGDAPSNRDLAFPWGGNHAKAKTVSFQAGFPDETRGVFPLRRGTSPTVKFTDGSAGLVVQGDIGHPISFFVHPSFASFNTREYYVCATVRRLSGGNVGMNLLYEVAESRGGSPYKNVGQWFGATKDGGWQTHTWHVKDACFSKMWGYDLVLRPEQSVPFAVGKVEVSTEPFQ